MLSIRPKKSWIFSNTLRALPPKASSAESKQPPKQSYFTILHSFKKIENSTCSLPSTKLPPLIKLSPSFLIPLQCNLPLSYNKASPRPHLHTTPLAFPPVCLSQVTAIWCQSPSVEETPLSASIGPPTSPFTTNILLNLSVKDKKWFIPVVIVAYSEHIHMSSIKIHTIRERHTRIALINTPHRKFNSDSFRWEIRKVVQDYYMLITQLKRKSKTQS